MNLRITALVLFFSIQAVPGAHAATAMLPGDAENGKKLHAAQCAGCHNTVMYTGKDRKIKTVEGLMAQVEACNRNLKKSFSPDQVSDLVLYLNEAFYKFE